MQDLLRLIFSGLTVISALSFLGLIILLHFLPNKFNPVKNTVSDYVARLSGKYNFVKAVPLAGAVSSFSLAIALATNINIASMSIVIFLVISSACRFLLIFFPTDITGQPATKIGKMHLIFAMISFGGIAFAAANFHTTLADFIIGKTVVFTAVLLLLGFLPQLKRIFGLLERIFLFSSIVWLIVVGSELFLKG